MEQTEMELQETDVINSAREYKETSYEKLQRFGLWFELGRSFGLRLEKELVLS